MKIVRNLFNRLSNIPSNIRDFIGIIALYLGISIFFLYGLIVSSGDVAQSDWALPLTPSVAANNLHSYLFAWSFSGFGSLSVSRYGLPFFPALNAVLAPFGFVGGTEIKLLPVIILVSAGVFAYLLGRSLSLGFWSSFLIGLSFMSTAIVFDWLIFGWIYFLFGYILFPVMLILVKKYLETNDLRYLLLNGLVLAVVAVQPVYILVYPTCGFLFVLLESKGKWTLIKRGLLTILVSVGIWLSTILSFFVSYNNAGTVSFYQGNFVDLQYSQFFHLGFLTDSIRLWGSTFNYQFGTYFPTQLIFLSFVPVIVASIPLLIRPHDKRVLFGSLCFLFVFVTYELYINMYFLVSRIPYGFIFEDPGIFLVPAGFGLALLLGFTQQIVSRKVGRLSSAGLRRITQIACFIGLFMVIVSGSIPWWTGQVSGQPVSGPPVKLNLYSMPSGYIDWEKAINASTRDDYFVLYMGLALNDPILNTTYFSEAYQGVNCVIYEGVNTVPAISAASTNLLMNEFVSNPQVGQRWGSYGIKYVVFYTNVDNAWALPKSVNRLSEENGFVQVANFTDVLVFEDLYAKPIVYSASSAAVTKITYHDPTTYDVEANSTEPFTLILNQAYSDGWVASVNGVSLPITSHVNATGFNSWTINETGSLTIKLYYEPQTVYLISISISVAVIIAIVLCIILITVRNARRSSAKKKSFISNT